MTPQVLRHLRKQYLTSFSAIAWEDVFPSFATHLDTTYYNDHRSIPGYLLKRSRVPISVFESLLGDLDVARRNIGERETLENEAAVQLAIHPIPNTLLSLFHGRLTNMPEHLMKGQMASSGRCEFTITFHGRLVLLFIELKHSLAVSNENHANIIAQVLAEADGADTANQSKEFDGVPIHAILTDGVHYEFYWISFNSWTVYRGMGCVTEGITIYGEPGRISLPGSERAPDYVGQLKVIFEVLLDTFLQTYINGIWASREYSARRTRFQTLPQGSGFRRRPSTGAWEVAHAKALTALEILREAHSLRVMDVDAADNLAKRGLQALKESALSIPHPELDWSYLDNWETRRAAIQRV